MVHIGNIKAQHFTKVPLYILPVTVFLILLALLTAKFYLHCFWSKNSLFYFILFYFTILMISFESLHFKISHSCYYFVMFYHYSMSSACFIISDCNNTILFGFHYYTVFTVFTVLDTRRTLHCLLIWEVVYCLKDWPWPTERCTSSKPF